VSVVVSGRFYKVIGSLVASCGDRFYKVFGFQCGELSFQSVRVGIAKSSVLQSVRVRRGVMSVLENVPVCSGAAVPFQQSDWFHSGEVSVLQRIHICY